MDYNFINQKMKKILKEFYLKVTIIQIIIIIEIIILIDILKVFIDIF